MTLSEKAERFIAKHRMIERGDHVVVGVSGGADSMCLLFLLESLADRLCFSISVVHVEHGIRGDEARQDAAYVASYCEEKGIDCEIVSVDIPAIAKEKGLSLEEAGRLERYLAFERGNPDKIAVAHHAEDVAETLLFNLFRGTGLKGAASIPAVNGKIIRPILEFSRAEIEACLSENGLSYRTDSTNLDNTYARNKIRNVILSAALEINPGSVRHLLLASEKLREADDYLEAEAEKLYNEYCVRNGVQLRLSLNIFEKSPKLLIKYVIFRVIRELSGEMKDFTERHIDMVLKLRNSISNSSVYLPNSVVVRREFGELIISKGESFRENGLKSGFSLVNTPIFPGGTVSLPDGSIYRFSFPEPDEVPGTGPDFTVENRIYTKWIDYDRIKQGAVFRTRLPGDRLSIRGGTKKLKDFFIEKKIPQNQRDQIFFLADGKQVIWIPGFRLSEEYKVRSDTVRVLMVSKEE